MFIRLSAEKPSRCTLAFSKDKKSIVACILLGPQYVESATSCNDIVPVDEGNVEQCLLRKTIWTFQGSLFLILQSFREIVVRLHDADS